MPIITDNTVLSKARVIRCPEEAHAEFIDGKGEEVGTATITPSGGGVKISINVMNLPPGWLS